MLIKNSNPCYTLYKQSQRNYFQKFLQHNALIHFLFLNLLQYLDLFNQKILQYKMCRYLAYNIHDVLFNNFNNVFIILLQLLLLYLYFYLLNLFYQGLNDNPQAIEHLFHFLHQVFYYLFNNYLQIETFDTFKNYQLFFSI